MPVVQFSIPATGDCAPCCVPPCVEDGTSMDVTLTGITVCGCAITGDGKIYNVTGDPNDVLGVWTLPLNTPTTIIAIQMQAYTDTCVTPDGDPVDVDIILNVSCADGLYTVSVTFTTPTVPSATAEVFQATGELNTSLPNIVECVGSTTFNVPFVIDSAEVALT